MRLVGLAYLSSALAVNLLVLLESLRQDQISTQTRNGGCVQRRCLMVIYVPDVGLGPPDPRMHTHTQRTRTCHSRDYKLLRRRQYPSDLQRICRLLCIHRV